MSATPSANGLVFIVYPPAADPPRTDANSLEVTDLQIEFTIAWRKAPSDQKPNIKDYLSLRPAEEREEALRALLDAETELRRKTGQEPAWSDYKIRFAEDDFHI